MWRSQGESNPCFGPLRGPGPISEKEFEKDGGAVKEDGQSLQSAQVCRTQHEFDNNAESAEPCSKLRQTKSQTKRKF
jgi:hypothetical protein